MSCLCWQCWRWSWWFTQSEW